MHWRLDQARIAFNTSAEGIIVLPNGSIVVPEVAASPAELQHTPRAADT